MMTLKNHGVSNNLVLSWLRQWSKTDKPLEPAVYHYGIRAELIASAKARGTYGWFSIRIPNRTH